MMAGDLLNLIHREIARFLKMRRVSEMVGYIDSYNPNDHTAKVKFPTELDANGNPRITGWIPISAQAGGAGASWVVGPQIGDQCTVKTLEGDQEAGVISGFLHNTQDTPPAVQSGEGVLRHTPTGNYFKLAQDGSMQFFHKATGNYSKVDHGGNITGYIADPSKTQHYVGGDPAKGGSFAQIATVAGPSPYAQARYA